MKNFKSYKYATFNVVVDVHIKVTKPKCGSILDTFECFTAICITEVRARVGEKNRFVSIHK